MNNFTDVIYLKNYLRSQGFRPKDYMGQNFLVDEEALSQIILAADLSKKDFVLEVGPGLGVLTEELVKKAGTVLAVEKDKRLAEILKRRFHVTETFRFPSDRGLKASATSNLKIVNQDILRFHVQENIKSDYKVVANIPYYLTSKLFQYFLENQKEPKTMVLMVQKEVGERVIAKAGDLSVLGISVQAYAYAEIVYNVPKESFWPRPEVDSVILKITPKNKYPEITDKKEFFRIVKMAFAGKRKQVHNTLANGLKLPKEQILELLSESKIDPASRPQDLEIADWIRLYKTVVNIEVGH